jgi:hypothetical protein
MTKYVIALTASYVDESTYQVLEVYGPLDTKEHADTLAGYMNGRIAALNQAHYEDTGYLVSADVWDVQRVKVKHAANKAQALFDEVLGEQEPGYDLGGAWQRVPAPPEEVIHSPLLNDPVGS